jgi:hypothetical protein
LPFRIKLLQLNKCRINAKHDAIQPNKADLDAFVLSAREFSEEASRIIFSVDFPTISVLSQLDTGEPRDLLQEAEAAYRDGDFALTLTRCRQAFFLTFEKNYDISDFKDPSTPQLGLFALGCSAPYYTRNPEYISQSVKEPFDYIVLDHAHIDAELLKDGLDPVHFWNIWRLTPEVYKNRDGEWLTKRDIVKFQSSEVEQHAAYVLEHTIDLLLLRQERRRATRWIRDNMTYFVRLRVSPVKVYVKADKNSPIVCKTPDGVTEIFVTASLPGLSDSDTYWKVSHYGEGSLIYGYIHGDDIEADPA